MDDEYENFNIFGHFEEKKKCPIVSTIEKIGGHYDDENNFITRIVGGRTYIFDDVNLYCDLFAFTVGRLELRKSPKMEIHYREYIEPLLWIKTEEELIEWILNKGNITKMISEIVSEVVWAVDSLNKKIVNAAVRAARLGKCLDMALPHYTPQREGNDIEKLMAAHEYISNLRVDCVAKMPTPVPSPPSPKVFAKRTGAVEFGGKDINAFKRAAETFEKIRGEASEREAAAADLMESADNILRFIRGIRFIY